MRRILLATAGVLFMAVPAFTQTLRIALRQDLDVMDPTTATTYVVQWGGAHVWKVGGKVFAIGGWERGQHPGTKARHGR